MPTYIVVAQTQDNPVYIDHITAPDRDTAAQQIKQTLAQGVGVATDGTRSAIQIGLIDLAAFGTITPNPDGSQAQITYTNQQQAAIANLPTFTVSNVSQANTAIQAIRTLINTLLAELRSSGIIST